MFLFSILFRATNYIHVSFDVFGCFHPIGGIVVFPFGCKMQKFGKMRMISFTIYLVGVV